MIQTGRMAREVTLVDAGLGNVSSVERALIQVGGAVRVTQDPDQVARARLVVLPGQNAFGPATQAVVDGAMGAALRMVIERGDPFLGICLGMQLLFDGSDENGGREGLHVLPGRCRRFPDGMLVQAEAHARKRLRPIDPQLYRPRPTAPPAERPDYDDERRYATSHVLDDDPLARHTDLGAETTISSDEAAANNGASEASDFAPAPEPDVTPAVGTNTAIEVDPEPAPPPPAPENIEDLPPLQRRIKVPHTGWNDVEPTGDHYYFLHSYYVEAARSEDVMWMSTYGGIRFPAAVRRENVMGCQFHPEKSQRAGLKFLRAFLLGGWG